MQYLRNDELLYTSTKTPTFPLRIQSALEAKGTTITDVTIFDGKRKDPTAPTTTTTTTTPAAPAFQENIGGCCSGRNELGTLGLGYGGADTRSQRIEECKAMCASKADCVSFELHPGGPNRPESEIPGCWFSLTCKANEYPGGGCGHDLYIKQ